MLVVRTLDRLFFEEGNQRRSHIAGYRLFVYPLYGICENTFYSYLKEEDDDLSDLTLDPAIEAGLRKMVESVLRQPKWWDR